MHTHTPHHTTYTKWVLLFTRALSKVQLFCLGLYKQLLIQLGLEIQSAHIKNNVCFLLGNSSNTFEAAEGIRSIHCVVPPLLTGSAIFVLPGCMVSWLALQCSVHLVHPTGLNTLICSVTFNLFLQYFVLHWRVSKWVYQVGWAHWELNGNTVAPTQAIGSSDFDSSMWQSCPLELNCRT
jgi:hypothetical protein